jgi:glycerol-3-phosphate O-acyltransferase
MPPKPGLLQWVVQALQEQDCDDALLVPVSISFDQIAQMDDYIAINRGEPKRKESLAWFLGYIFGMGKSVGSIHVRFAEPLTAARRLMERRGLLAADEAANSGLAAMASELEAALAALDLTREAPARA